MRKLIVLIVMLPALAYLAWPAWAAWQLRAAVKARDVAAIESRVDWPLLRANLKKTVGDNLRDEARDPDAGVISRTLKRTVAPFLADRVIDAAVTPRTLERVLSGRLASVVQPPPPSPAPQGEAGDAETSDPLSPRRLRWAFFETPTRFRIETVDRRMPGKRIVTILALQGASWQLVDVYYVTAG